MCAVRFAPAAGAAVSCEAQSRPARCPRQQRLRRYPGAPFPHRSPPPAPQPTPPPETRHRGLLLRRRSGAPRGAAGSQEWISAGGGFSSRLQRGLAGPFRGCRRWRGAPLRGLWRSIPESSARPAAGAASAIVVSLQRPSRPKPAQTGPSRICFVLPQRSPASSSPRLVLASLSEALQTLLPCGFPTARHGLPPPLCAWVVAAAPESMYVVSLSWLPNPISISPTVREVLYFEHLGFFHLRRK